jgi:hypothetical protein
MKLRIQGNSLRLRLAQKEVAQLRKSQHVESAIEFGPGRQLVYLLNGSVWAASASVSFDGHAIRVTVPSHEMTEWADSDRVGLEATSQSGVQLLIEKDYQCLHRPREQDADAYPHPLMSGSDEAV